MNKDKYFIKNGTYDPTKDEIIEFLSMDDNEDYSWVSPEKVMARDEFEKKSRSEIAKFYKESGVNGYSIFNQLRNDQITELKSCKKELLEFYTTAWDYSKFGNGKFSPMDIVRLTIQKKVRIARLREILTPQFALTTVPHSKTGHKYRVARAYWWDDNGKRSRSITRSVIREEFEIIERLADLYEDLGFEVFKNMKMSNNTIADMLITKKQEQYIVEVKMTNEEDLARMILTLSMWQEYKKSYT